MVGVQLTEMAVTGLTVRMAVAFWEVSWLEMAVTVTWVLAVTAWAVNSPVASMVPALAAQVTVLMKLPVPVTVAVHWLYWPDWSDVGVQDIVIAETVAVELPPLQAVMPTRDARDIRRARKRKPVPQETKRMQPGDCK